MSISAEAYKNLQIGDEVVVNGYKCSIFSFEDHPPVPVGVLEPSATFGIEAGKNPKFAERLKAQIAAGYSGSAKTYRLHNYEIQRIFAKAKNNFELKKLKREDLSQLRVGDIILIDGIERKIESTEIDNICQPWIKSEKGIFPCGGDCHPRNKNQNLDFNSKYDSLNSLISTKDIYLKSIQTNQKKEISKKSKKEIYYEVLSIFKSIGYDYGTSVFAELNECYDEIEIFFPDPDLVDLFKDLKNKNFCCDFFKSEKSEFYFSDSDGPIEKDVYNVSEKGIEENKIKLSCLIDVDIFDENDEVVDSTILSPLKNGVSADVFALYKDFDTQKLKALNGYDLDKILDNIKNKIYYPTGKKKISEKEAELLKRFGFTEKANVIEDSKENVIMSEKVGLVNLVKSDAQEAAYRTAAKKGVRALRAAMLRVAKDKGAVRKEVDYLRKAFESDLGEAVLSMALGYMLTYAPLPETVKNNKHFGRIVGELRIGGIQIGMDTILTEAMGYIGPVLDEIKGLLPEDSEEIATVLPARIAKPTTKRIKSLPKDDLDESEEDEVAEKSAKKA